MLDFNYNNKTEIIFGKGTESTVGIESKKYGKKILLHYGGGSIKRTGLYSRIVTSLQDENIEFIELGGVKPNPRLSLVREGIRMCKEQGVDFILAVGGGSVIDSAKAIAAGTVYDGDVWDFFSGTAVSKALPIGVVLTIPAAGSETSNGAVITNEEGWLKRAMGSLVLRPQFAIMNPELTFTLPAYQTSCGAVDIMAHVMERYFTNTKNVDFTDRLCEATLKTMIHNTPKALKEPEDYNSRAEIMWASTIAHNGLLDTGRESDWASHNIEHELSGIYDIAHGAGLAIIFPAWMKYCLQKNPDKLVQYAVRVWDVEYNPENHKEIAIEGIRRFEVFLKSIEMPIRLSEIDISDDRFEEMALKAAGSNTIGSYVKLDKDAIKEIYELAK
ncbi:iron-containing alcohol dehydrogenase [Wukongibacter baidiensis]|uniref:iron-containing alcohol dehydrogenase n=1 Tax=Wukongibacter baidiensis TaxID=1723361 RepID=UPI003D7F9848